RDAIAADSPTEIAIVSGAPSNDLSDAWILSRLNTTVKETTAALENLRVNEAVKMLYDFMWHDFCDWYVEFAKNRIAETSDINLKRAIVNRAIRIYEETLKLLHPFMPFVTEEIWQHLSERKDGESIMESPWPAFDESPMSAKTDGEMEFLQSVISAVRTVRSEMNL